MSKEILHALEEDVLRLLIAGSALASDDAGLRARKPAVAALADRVSALSKVSDQLNTLLATSAEKCGEELLNLTVMMQQLRGAQAQPGHTDGEVSKLPAVTIPLDSPMVQYEVDALYRTLINKQQPVATVKQYAERGLGRDLRLLDAWLAAILWALTDEVLKVIGDSIAEPLQKSFYIRGGAIDARRLECLARIDKMKVRDLLLKAIEKGSPKVAAVALQELGTLDYHTAEPIAERLVQNAKKTEVRFAAANVLKNSSKENVLKLLIDTIFSADNETDISIARETLKTLPQDVIKPLLDRITPELFKQLTPKDDSKMGFDRFRLELSRLNHVIAILDKRFEETKHDIRALWLMCGIWNAHPAGYTRSLAGELILRFEDRPSLMMMANSINYGVRVYMGDGNQPARLVAIKAYLQLHADAYDLMAPRFTWAKLASHQGLTMEMDILSVLKEQVEKIDRRWLDLSLNLLKDEEFWFPRRGSEIVFYLDRIFDLLGNAREPRAKEIYLKLLDKAVNPDPFRFRLWKAIYNLSDPSLIDPVRQWLQKNNIPEKDFWFRPLVQQLERYHSNK